MVDRVELHDRWWCTFCADCHESGEWINRDLDESDIYMERFFRSDELQASGINGLDICDDCLRQVQHIDNPTKRDRFV